MASLKINALKKFALGSSFAVASAYGCVGFFGLAQAQSTLPELRSTIDEDAYRLQPLPGRQNSNPSGQNESSQQIGQANTVQFGGSSRLPRLRTLRDRQLERRRERGETRSSSPALNTGPSGLGSIDTENATGGSVARAPIPLSEPTVLAERPEQPVPQVQDPEVLTGSLDRASPTSLGNAPAGRVQAGNPSTVEEEPFAPVGTRWGVFDITARISQFFGYSSNFRKSAGGEAAAFSQTNANLGVVSNWSRHELRFNADGTYLTAFDDDEDDQPQLNLNSRLRLDLVDGWTVAPEIFYNFSTESFSSRELSSDVSQSPELNAYGGAIEIARTGRKLDLRLRGEVTQNTFSDAKLDDGTRFDQSDRDNTRYQVTARVGYETSPAFRPFVEGVYGFRDFNNGRDRNGIDRNSQTYEIRAGVAFDLGEKLQVELALGYLATEYEDSALDRLEAYTLNGNLVWSPVRDTTVSLNLATTASPSTQADTSGTINYDLAIDYQQQLTDRLSVNLNGGAILTRDEGSGDQDLTLSAGAGLEYFLNRNWAVAGELDYEQFQADDSDRDYEDVTGRIGIVWQK